MVRQWFVVCLVLCVVLTGCNVPATKPSSNDLTSSLAAFEQELEALRVEMKIPGLSAAVVQDGQVVWARGLGYADLEKQVPARPETAYHLASVTKTSAAVVVMRLVQDGKLSLDDPVTRYGVYLPEGDRILVRHLLSHTSEGTPGQRFQYNGMRYGMLSQVVLGATGRSLQDWLYELVLAPLRMRDTAPGPAAMCAGLSFAAVCERVEAALTVPYMLDADLNPVRGIYGDTYNAGAGLMSTVLDLTRFDKAMDDNRLVTAETKALMWTPTLSNSGQELSYGLGWFVQTYRGTKMVFHTGYSPPSTSALYLKLPEKKLTLIVLANTDLLSRCWNSTGGDVLDSPVAAAFYKWLVVAPESGGEMPTLDYGQDDQAVLGALRQVQNEEQRDILYREYSARKGIAAALGDLQMQVKALHTVIHRAQELYATVNTTAWQGYAGDYTFAEAGGTVAHISYEGGRLYASQGAEPPQELLPLSESRFFVPSGYYSLELTFGNDPADGSGRLYLTMYGLSFTGRRQ